MNPYTLLIAIAVVLGAGWGGFQLGVDHELASQKRLDDQVQRVTDAVKHANAQAIGALRPKYTTIQNQLEKQIETSTVYRDCKLDATGLQLANQALSGGTAATDDSNLPKVDAPPK